jgi:hypothetical protein
MRHIVRFALAAALSGVAFAQLPNNTQQTAPNSRVNVRTLPSVSSPSFIAPTGNTEEPIEVNTATPTVNTHTHNTTSTTSVTTTTTTIASDEGGDVWDYFENRSQR